MKMSNNTCSDIPPTNPDAGDLWYNTSDNNFYVFDQGIWDPVMDEDTVFNLIVQDEDEDDPIKAHDRAMSII